MWGSLLSFSLSFSFIFSFPLSPPITSSFPPSIIPSLPHSITYLSVLVLRTFPMNIYPFGSGRESKVEPSPCMSNWWATLQQCFQVYRFLLQIGVAITQFWLQCCTDFVEDKLKALLLDDTVGFLDLKWYQILYMTPDPLGMIYNDCIYTYEQQKKNMVHSSFSARNPITSLYYPH